MKSKDDSKRTRAVAPRDERMHLRLSAEEKAAIEEAAAAAGEDVSVWIRRAARERLEREARKASR